MEKTVLDWLNELPVGYRALAIRDSNKEDLELSSGNICNALSNGPMKANAHKESWEKFEFWRQVWDHYNNPLPVLFKD